MTTWPQLLSRISTAPGAALPMRVYPVLDAYGRPAMGLSFWGHDIVQPGPPTWHPTNLYPVPPCRDIREQVRYVLGLHEIQAVHEAREAFLFDGVRVFEPHPGVQR